MKSNNNAQLLFIAGIAGLFFLYPLGIILLFLASGSYREAGDAGMARTSKLIAWIALGFLLFFVVLGILLLTLGIAFG